MKNSERGSSVDTDAIERYKQNLERRVCESGGAEQDAWAHAYGSFLMGEAKRKFPSLTATTLFVGIVFATALSLAWMMQLSSAGTHLAPEPTSSFEKFIAAAGRLKAVHLWMTIFCGAFLLWCAIIALAGKLSCVIAETSFCLSACDSGFSPQYKRFLLGFESVLLVVLVVAWVMVPAVWDAVHMKENPAYPVGPLFFFFLPLLVGTWWYDDESVIHFIVWQICVFLAHPLFVLSVEYALLGRMSLYDYAAGGLCSFGYASWWFLSFVGYRVCERLNSP